MKARKALKASMNLEWVAAPLIGAAIGFFTNWVAIKMLFRPRRAVYVGKFHLPMTPGLIPREKARLARSVGEVVGEKLLSQAALQEALLAPEMTARVEGALKALIDAGLKDEETIEDFAARLAGKERLDGTLQNLAASAGDLLYAKIVAADLGKVAAGAIVEHVRKKSPSALSGLVKSVLDERGQTGVTAALREGVNNYVLQNGRALIGGAIDDQLGGVKGLRVCDALKSQEDKLPALVARLLQAYEAAVRAALPRALLAVDIPAVVRGRIEQLDEAELEQTILSVIDRELRAIVLLGGALGFVMGFVNIIF